jgi:Flp pilus assembly protein TadB
VTVVLLLGAGVGLGLVAVIRGLWPPQPSLKRALAELDRPRSPDGGHDRPPLLRRTADAVVRGPQADLAILGRSPEQQALRKLVAATVMGVLPALAVAAAGIGGVSVGPGAAAVPTAVLAGVGFVVPDLELRSLARDRRQTFVHALSGYLDVTAVLLAGGAGTETALYAAANLSDEWPQRMLRTALDGARLSGQTPWRAFGTLGDRLGVTELSQLATSLELAGEQGARVRTTLTERARALRASQLAEVEARARAATEQMSVPVALLAVGFMLFVGFPAVWIVLGEL